MKKIIRSLRLQAAVARAKAILLAVLLGGVAFSSPAQYYEIANQLPSLIQPALSGSMRYKGFVEAHYLKGLGNRNADFVGASTSQGFQYSSWFFMGVGIGVDGIFSHTDDGFGNWAEPDMSVTEHDSRTSGVTVPIFTDFRFTIGNASRTSMYAGVKVGCAFLMGQDYMRIGNGYLTNQEYFYLRPSLGVRIPVNPQNPKQAVSVGVDYQLLTANYWNSWNRNITLNSLGVSLSYEW